MSTEANKALVRRLFEEAWNQGNLTALDELMVPDHAGHHALVANQPPGRDLYKQFIVRVRTAFPDFHATIDDQIAEGDLIVTRWTGQGTHQGTHMGISPTGNQMSVTGIVIYRIVGGKAVEGWMEMDMLGMMQQLGVPPQPGQTS